MTTRKSDVKTMSEVKNKYKVPVYSKLPAGWHKLTGATTAPLGYYWANNGKSRFGGEYKHALIRDSVACAKIIKAEKEWMKERKARR